jgi:hypothetical protein
LEFAGVTLTVVQEVDIVVEYDVRISELEVVVVGDGAFPVVRIR